MNYRICKKCVMDTSDPDIVFNDEGVCHHCLAYDDRAAKELKRGESGKAELARVINQIKKEGENKPYDCIIGVSGGVDSTLVAYLCKQQGLRPLAIHFDNGWNSELSVSNIEKTLEKLKIDLYTYVVDWEEFKELQLSFFKASVPNLEIPTDHAITALLFKMAAKHNIRFIIGGSNLVTEATMPKAWVYDHRDSKHLFAINRKFGSRKIKKTPTYNLVQLAYFLFGKRIRYIKLLNYFDMHRDEVLRILEQELGWVYYGGKHHESIFTRFLQSYYLPEKFNYDKRRAHFSTLICSGQLTRVEALEQLKRPIAPPELIKDDCEFVAKKFGLSEAEFAAIMARPRKAHTEFPSLQRFFLQRQAPWFQWFRRLATQT